MRPRVNKPVNSTVNYDKVIGDSRSIPGERTHLDVSSEPHRIPRRPVSPRYNTASIVSLCVVHLFFAFVIGLHEEWTWSKELLRVVTKLSHTVAAFTEEPDLNDVIKPKVVVTSPSLMNVSLYKTFSLDWTRVLAERERNMEKYNFPYNRSGVDKRSNLSLEEYRDVYDGKWPVIIQDVVSTWKASNWTHEFLCDNYGQERVGMKAIREGRLDKATTVSLPLGLFCKHTNITSPTAWTYVEDEFFLPTRPYLRSDVGQSIYTEDDMFQLFPEEIRPWDAFFLWGTKYSRSSLHIDPYNWTGTNAVIRGIKRWKLFQPGQDHLLYVMPHKLSYFPLNCFKYNSPIDTFDPADYERYPLYKQAKYLEVDHLPGELLIIPTGWFHQAFNDDETIAVSGQMTNVNNYRVVLEEILKLRENLERTMVPANSKRLPPSELVSLVMSLLPKQILELGRKTTQENLQQIQRTGL